MERKRWVTWPVYSNMYYYILHSQVSSRIQGLNPLSPDVSVVFFAIVSRSVTNMMFLCFVQNLYACSLRAVYVQAAATYGAYQQEYWIL